MLDRSVLFRGDGVIEIGVSEEGLGGICSDLEEGAAGTGELEVV